LCSEKFPQEDKIYGGEATKETVGKRNLRLKSTDEVDPANYNNFHTQGLRDYQELQVILKDLNLDKDNPLEAKDCSPGQGVRYAYIANGLGLEAVEFCQKGEYFYFKFVCVAPSAGGEVGQQPVIKESGTGAEAFDPTGKSVGGGYINEEGYITMTIRTEGTSLSGGDVFNAIYDALHAKVYPSRAWWGCGPATQSLRAIWMLSTKRSRIARAPKTRPLKGPSLALCVKEEA
jgi:hypothetical protein